MQHELLRHTLAALAYRAARAMDGAPAGFENQRVAATTRSAGEIAAHLTDLMDWALSIAQGKQKWANSPSLPWDEGCARFFSSLTALDEWLAANESKADEKRLFQGPIADALTHVGQIATLRRVAGSPVPGENYYRADIAIGRAGADQPVAARPF